MIDGIISPLRRLLLRTNLKTCSHIRAGHSNEVFGDPPGFMTFGSQAELGDTNIIVGNPDVPLGYSNATGDDPMTNDCYNPSTSTSIEDNYGAGDGGQPARMREEYQEMMALLHEASSAAASPAMCSLWLGKVRDFLKRTPWHPNRNTQIGGYDARGRHR